MPELPEVELFRQLLLPLVSDKHKLCLDLKENAPKKWLSQEESDSLSDYFCTNVLRKGKQLALVLRKNPSFSDSEKFLLLHMGMTGRISSPQRSLRLKANIKDDGSVFPPKHTYLTLQAGTYTAAFTDHRKLSSCHLSNDLSSFESLAPDALDTVDPALVQGIVSQMTEQNSGIKALLMDQKRVVSGVGNWVADEVLYQCEMHPDQTNLSSDQAQALWQTLQSILSTVIDCLGQDVDYPDSWLFPYRWTKKKPGKDSKGRSLSFVTSGGRTSVIVGSIQKLHKRKRAEAGNSEHAKTKKNKLNAREKHNKPLKSKKVDASANEKSASSRRRSPRLAG